MTQMTYSGTKVKGKSSCVNGKWLVILQLFLCNLVCWQIPPTCTWASVFYLTIWLRYQPIRDVITYIYVVWYDSSLILYIRFCLTSQRLIFAASEVQLLKTRRLAITDPYMRHLASMSKRITWINMIFIGTLSFLIWNSGARIERVCTCVHRA